MSSAPATARKAGILHEIAASLMLMIERRKRETAERRARQSRQKMERYHARTLQLEAKLRLYQAEEERLLEDRRRDREEVDYLKYGTVACPRCGAEFDRSDVD